MPKHAGHSCECAVACRCAADLRRERCACVCACKLAGSWAACSRACAMGCPAVAGLPPDSCAFSAHAGPGTATPHGPIPSCWAKPSRAMIGGAVLSGPCPVGPCRASLAPCQTGPMALFGRCHTQQQHAERCCTACTVVPPCPLWHLGPRCTPPSAVLLASSCALHTHHHQQRRRRLKPEMQPRDPNTAVYTNASTQK